MGHHADAVARSPPCTERVKSGLRAPASQGGHRRPMVHGRGTQNGRSADASE